MYEQIYAPDYYVLEHHGILGQKWGVRRYQNKDGSFTAAGRSRYVAKNKVGAQPRLDRHKSKTAASEHTKHQKNIRAVEENIRIARLINQNNMMLANISEANRASAIGTAASWQFLYPESPEAPYPHTVYGNYLTYG